MTDYRNYKFFSCWLLFCVLLPSCIGISITVHTKPQETSTVGTSVEITTVENLTQEESKKNDSSTLPERQKRLLPYINYYVAQNRTYVNPENQKPKRYHVYVPGSIQEDPQLSYNHYSPKDKNIYTPFLETNALPGPFVPIVRHPQKNFKIHYITLQKQQPKQTSTDFGEIYGKLWELKSKHQHPQPVYVENYKLPQKFIRKPENYPVRYKLQPTKTIVQTYSPTSIDIPPSSTGEDYGDKIYQQPQTTHLRNENVANQYAKPVLIDVPSKAFVQRPKQKQAGYRKPLIVLQRPPTYFPRGHEGKPVENPVIYVQSRPVQNYKHYSSPIVEENYVAQKYINVPKYQNLQSSLPATSQDYFPNYYKYEPDYQIQTVTPSPFPTSTEQIYIDQNQIRNENSNSLGLLLKKLQDANALPETLTVNNIDNSIRTLVKILKSLKKHQKLSRPIVVAEENEEYHSGEYSSTEDYSLQPQEVTQPLPVVPQTSIHAPVVPERVIQESIVPEPIAHNYSEDTQEGGTPGTPGVDYPALSSIPPTSFNCKTQRYKGFFGDPDTNCQVWHYCDLNGGQASFLCPNGTIFSQVALTCDWWYNVKCSSTAQLYVLNERLYKYILPFVPKFPEDYTGPLVDKYLALKFMEMEEKMKKERKGKEESQEETTTLDDISEDTTSGPPTKPT